jgi:hypothetical protein
MKKSLLCIVPVLVLFMITILMADEDNSIDNLVVVVQGKVPTIDGVISENEWNDASVLNLEGDAHIYLKHDEVNLYIATDCAVGNFFIIIDERMYVFHASYSLGMAVYDYNDTYHLWSCTKEYFWELRHPQIRNKSKEERQKLIYQYMRDNGWVASTVPMAKEEHNEMVISLNRLGINPMLGTQVKELFPILISHTTFHWPIKDRASGSINSLIGGSCPEIIELDYLNWGRIIIE